MELVLEKVYSSWFKMKSHWHLFYWYFSIYLL